MRLVVNPLSQRGAYGDAERQVVSLRAAREARTEMSRWPGYQPSPLRALTALGGRLGLSEVLYKDESERFSLGSFKALGGGYAAGRELQRRLQRELGTAAELADVYAGRHARQLKSLTLCCATDGNHGLSVAHAAERVGCSCVVFMHEHASERKAAAIRSQGAEVRFTPGTYDDSVRIARAAAQTPGWVLIADTWGCLRRPRRILHNLLR